MADREKVIKAVGSCFNYWLEQNRYLHLSELENVRRLKADAIAMLKEQDNCEKEKNMKIIVDGRTIDEDDIKDILSTNPKEYHIDNMEPFLTIDLKDGERITTSNFVKIVYE